MFKEFKYYAIDFGNLFTNQNDSAQVCSWLPCESLKIHWQENFYRMDFEYFALDILYCVISDSCDKIFNNWANSVEAWFSTRILSMRVDVWGYTQSAQSINFLSFRLSIRPNLFRLNQNIKNPWLQKSHVSVPLSLQSFACIQAKKWRTCIAQPNLKS